MGNQCSTCCQCSCTKRHQYHNNGSSGSSAYRKRFRDEPFACHAKRPRVAVSFTGDAPTDFTSEKQNEIIHEILPPLNIEANDPPFFVRRLENVSIKIGSRSWLTVELITDARTKVSWYLKNREVLTTDRIHLRNYNKLFAVEIDSVHVEDAGEWMCMIENESGRSSCVCDLNVLVPKAYKPPRFVEELRAYLAECGTVSLECKVVGVPTPILKWFKDSKEIKAGDIFALTVNSNDQNSLGTYSCEAVNCMGTSMSTSKVHLKGHQSIGDNYILKGASVGGFSQTHHNGRKGNFDENHHSSYQAKNNYRKPRFVEPLKATFTTEGYLSFECKIVGFPTPNLQWYKDGRELNPGDVYHLTGLNSLGTYCCIARNCMGESSSATGISIEDIDGDIGGYTQETIDCTPIFVQGLMNQEAVINTKYRFTVQARSKSQISVEWYRDEVPIITNNRYEIISEGPELYGLKIRSVDLIDQAEWKCVASNESGSTTSLCFLKLLIPRHYRKPKFLDPLKAFLSEEGIVNLECKVIGIPQPVLRWYKDGQELRTGDIHGILPENYGRLTLGTYTCEARNCMGFVETSSAVLGLKHEVTSGDSNPAKKAAHERKFSLSTIQEELSAQFMSAVEELSVDGVGDISFSFDGKEVSVSLYETPDLTEEEALQIVELYADQISEHITEQNVINFPPLRFLKETSQSGNLLMEAVVVHIDPEYFSAEYHTETDKQIGSSISVPSIHDISSLSQKNTDDSSSDLAAFEDVKIFTREMFSREQRTSVSESDKPVMNGFGTNKHSIFSEDFLQQLMLIAKCVVDVQSLLVTIKNEIHIHSSQMMSTSSADQSLQIVNNIMKALHSVEMKLAAFTGKESIDEISEALYDDFQILQTTLRVLENCIELDERGHTLVKRASVAIIEICGDLIHAIFQDTHSLLSTRDKCECRAQALNTLIEDVIKIIQITQDLIKSQQNWVDSHDLDEALHLSESVARVQDLPPYPIVIGEANVISSPIHSKSLEIIDHRVFETQTILREIEKSCKPPNQINFENFLLLSSLLDKSISKISDELRIINSCISERFVGTTANKIALGIVDAVSPGLFEITKGAEKLCHAVVNSENMPDKLALSIVKSIAVPLHEIQIGLAQIKMDVGSSHSALRDSCQMEHDQFKLKNEILTTFERFLVKFQPELDERHFLLLREIQRNLTQFATIQNDLVPKECFTELLRTLIHPIDQLNYSMRNAVLNNDVSLSDIAGILNEFSLQSGLCEDFLSGNEFVKDSCDATILMKALQQCKFTAKLAGMLIRRETGGTDTLIDWVISAIRLTDWIKAQSSGWVSTHQGSLISSIETAARRIDSVKYIAIATIVSNESPIEKANLETMLPFFQQNAAELIKIQFCDESISENLIKVLLKLVGTINLEKLNTSSASYMELSEIKKSLNEIIVRLVVSDENSQRRAHQHALQSISNLLDLQNVLKFLLLQLQNYKGNDKENDVVVFSIKEIMEGVIERCKLSHHLEKIGNLEYSKPEWRALVDNILEDVSIAKSLLPEAYVGKGSWLSCLVRLEKNLLVMRRRIIKFHHNDGDNEIQKNSEARIVAFDIRNQETDGNTIESQQSMQKVSCTSLESNAENMLTYPAVKLDDDIQTESNVSARTSALDISNLSALDAVIFQVLNHSKKFEARVHSSVECEVNHLQKCQTQEGTFSSEDDDFDSILADCSGEIRTKTAQDSAYHSKIPSEPIACLVTKLPKGNHFESCQMKNLENVHTASYEQVTELSQMQITDFSDSHLKNAHVLHSSCLEEEKTEDKHNDSIKKPLSDLLPDSNAKEGGKEDGEVAEMPQLATISTLSESMNSETSDSDDFKTNINLSIISDDENAIGNSERSLQKFLVTEESIETYDLAALELSAKTPSKADQSSNSDDQISTDLILTSEPQAINSPSKQRGMSISTMMDAEDISKTTEHDKGAVQFQSGSIHEKENLIFCRAKQPQLATISTVSQTTKGETPQNNIDISMITSNVEHAIGMSDKTQQKSLVHQESIETHHLTASETSAKTPSNADQSSKSDDHMSTEPKAINSPSNSRETLIKAIMGTEDVAMTTRQEDVAVQFQSTIKSEKENLTLCDAKMPQLATISTLSESMNSETSDSDDFKTNIKLSIISDDKNAIGNSERSLQKFLVTEESIETYDLAALELSAKTPSKADQSSNSDDQISTDLILTSEPQAINSPSKQRGMSMSTMMDAEDISKTTEHDKGAVQFQSGSIHEKENLIFCRAKQPQLATISTVSQTTKGETPQNNIDISMITSNVEHAIGMSDKTQQKSLVHQESIETHHLTASETSAKTPSKADQSSKSDDHMSTELKAINSPSNSRETLIKAIMGTEDVAMTTRQEDVAVQFQFTIKSEKENLTLCDAKMPQLATISTLSESMNSETSDSDDFKTNIKLSIISDDKNAIGNSERSLQKFLVTEESIETYDLTASESSAKTPSKADQSSNSDDQISTDLILTSEPQAINSPSKQRKISMRIMMDAEDISKTTEHDDGAVRFQSGSIHEKKNLIFCRAEQPQLATISTVSQTTKGETPQSNFDLSMITSNVEHAIGMSDKTQQKSLVHEESIETHHLTASETSAKTPSKADQSSQSDDHMSTDPKAINSPSNSRETLIMTIMGTEDVAMTTRQEDVAVQFQSAIKSEKENLTLCDAKMPQLATISTLSESMNSETSDSDDFKTNINLSIISDDKNAIGNSERSLQKCLVTEESIGTYDLAASQLSTKTPSKADQYSNSDDQISTDLILTSEPQTIDSPSKQREISMRIMMDAEDISKTTEHDDGAVRFQSGSIHEKKNLIFCRAEQPQLATISTVSQTTKGETPQSNFDLSMITSNVEHAIGMSDKTQQKSLVHEESIETHHLTASETSAKTPSKADQSSPSDDHMSTDPKAINSPSNSRETLIMAIMGTEDVAMTTRQEDVAVQFQSAIKSEKENLTLCDAKMPQLATISTLSESTNSETSDSDDFKTNINLSIISDDKNAIGNSERSLQKCLVTEESIGTYDLAASQLSTKTPSKADQSSNSDDQISTDLILTSEPQAINSPSKQRKISMRIMMDAEDISKTTEHDDGAVRFQSGSIHEKKNLIFCRAEQPQLATISTVSQTTKGETPQSNFDLSMITSNVEHAIGMSDKTQQKSLVHEESIETHHLTASETSAKTPSKADQSSQSDDHMSTDPKAINSPSNSRETLIMAIMGTEDVAMTTRQEDVAVQFQSAIKSEKENLTLCDAKMPQLATISTLSESTNSETSDSDDFKTNINLSIISDDKNAIGNSERSLQKCLVTEESIGTYDLAASQLSTKTPSKADQSSNSDDQISTDLILTSEPQAIDSPSKQGEISMRIMMDAEDISKTTEHDDGAVRFQSGSIHEKKNLIFCRAEQPQLATISTVSQTTKGETPQSNFDLSMITSNVEHAIGISDKTQQKSLVHEESIETYHLSASEASAKTPSKADQSSKSDDHMSTEPKAINSPSNSRETLIKAIMGTEDVAMTTRQEDVAVQFQSAIKSEKENLTLCDAKMPQLATISTLSESMNSETSDSDDFKTNIKLSIISDDKNAIGNSERSLQKFLVTEESIETYDLAALELSAKTPSKADQSSNSDDQMSPDLILTSEPQAINSPSKQREMSMSTMMDAEDISKTTEHDNGAVQFQSGSIHEKENLIFCRAEQPQLATVSTVSQTTKGETPQSNFDLSMITSNVEHAIGISDKTQQKSLVHEESIETYHLSASEASAKTPSKADQSSKSDDHMSTEPKAINSHSNSRETLIMAIMGTEDVAMTTRQEDVAVQFQSAIKSEKENLTLCDAKMPQLATISTLSESMNSEISDSDDFKTNINLSIISDDENAIGNSERSLQKFLVTEESIETYDLAALELSAKTPSKADQSSNADDQISTDLILTSEPQAINSPSKQREISMRTMMHAEDISKTTDDGAAQIQSSSICEKKNLTFCNAKQLEFSTISTFGKLMQGETSESEVTKTNFDLLTSPDVEQAIGSLETTLEKYVVQEESAETCHSSSIKLLAETPSEPAQLCEFLDETCVEASTISILVAINLPIDGGAAALRAMQGFEEVELATTKSDGAMQQQTESRYEIENSIFSIALQSVKGAISGVQPTVLKNAIGESDIPAVKIKQLDSVSSNVEICHLTSLEPLAETIAQVNQHREHYYQMSPESLARSHREDIPSTTQEEATLKVATTGCEEFGLKETRNDKPMQQLIVKDYEIENRIDCAFEQPKKIVGIKEEVHDLAPWEASSDSKWTKFCDLSVVKLPSNLQKSQCIDSDMEQKEEGLLDAMRLKTFGTATSSTDASLLYKSLQKSYIEYHKFCALSQHLKQTHIVLPTQPLKSVTTSNSITLHANLASAEQSEFEAASTQNRIPIVPFQKCHVQEKVSSDQFSNDKILILDTNSENGKEVSYIKPAELEMGSFPQIGAESIISVVQNETTSSDNVENSVNLYCHKNESERNPFGFFGGKGDESPQEQTSITSYVEKKAHFTVVSEKPMYTSGDKLTHKSEDISLVAQPRPTSTLTEEEVQFTEIQNSDKDDDIFQKTFKINSHSSVPNEKAKLTSKRDSQKSDIEKGRFFSSPQYAKQTMIALATQLCKGENHLIKNPAFILEDIQNKDPNGQVPSIRHPEIDELEKEKDCSGELITRFQKSEKKSITTIDVPISEKLACSVSSAEKLVTDIQECELHQTWNDKEEDEFCEKNNEFYQQISATEILSSTWSDRNKKTKLSDKVHKVLRTEKNQDTNYPNNSGYLTNFDRNPLTIQISEFYEELEVLQHSAQEIDLPDDGPSVRGNNPLDYLCFTPGQLLTEEQPYKEQKTDFEIGQTSLHGKPAHHHLLKVEFMEGIQAGE